MALLSGLRIWRCCEPWCRLADAARILGCCGSGVGTVAPIRPLVWEPPYTTGEAQEIAKRPKKKKKDQQQQKKC